MAEARFYLAGLFRQLMKTQSVSLDEMARELPAQAEAPITARRGQTAWTKEFRLTKKRSPSLSASQATNPRQDEVFLASHAVEPCDEEILPWLPSGLTGHWAPSLLS